VQSRTYSTKAEKFLGKPDGAMYMTAIFNLRTKAARVLDKKGRPYMKKQFPSSVKLRFCLVGKHRRSPTPPLHRRNRVSGVADEETPNTSVQRELVKVSIVDN
jgi:hypothetical protein